MNKMIKNRFSKSEKVVSAPGEGRAQQQFKEHCDINNIMRKFDATGIVTHVAKAQPREAFPGPQTLHEAMNIVAQANSLFEQLPAKLRSKFHNSPSALMEFIDNPENRQQAIELGLIRADDTGEMVADLNAATAAKLNAGGDAQLPEGQQASPEVVSDTD